MGPSCFSVFRVPFLNSHTDETTTSTTHSTPSGDVDKPIEQNHIDNLPDATPDHLADGLKALVEHSSSHSDVSQNIHATVLTISRIPWFDGLIPGIEKLAARYHVGNFVIVRYTNEKIFETMPIYARSVCRFFILYSLPIHIF